MTSTSFRALAIDVCATLVAGLLLLSPIAAYGQNYAGSVRGTVTDPSGAAVPGATVTLRDVATNATSKATTTDLGAFFFPVVNVGTYEVTINAPSFRAFVAKNVEVHVSTPTELNAKLEVGAATETLTVEATDVQVQTSTADVGEVIEGTQVRELPLNGRNFMSLTQLQAGVSANNQFNSRDKGLQGGSDFSVNGNPSTNNLFLIDGVNNNDVGSNRTILIYPSVDSVAEFKMLTNSYGPEYGQASGAIISITTRSGTNQFHGGMFYEGRNDALNAPGYVADYFGLPKPSLRRNDWGYFVGGPIVKNKLFFWWNQEWNRDLRGQIVTQCVPTAAERGGDFSADVNLELAALTSGAAVDATHFPTTTCNAPPPATFTNTGGVWSASSNIPTAFQATGNQYAVAKPDAVGQLLAAYYPLPNLTTLLPNSNDNFASGDSGRVPWREENARIDYDVSSRNRISFRYTQDSWKFPAPNNAFGWGDDNFATYQGSWDQPSKSIMGKLTSQITNSLVNDFEFGYAHNAIIVTPGGTNPTLSNQFDAALPPLWPSGGKTAGGIPTVWGGLNQYGNFSSIWAIVGYGNHMDLFTWQDNVAKIQGNHIWKFGGLVSHNVKQENQFGGSDRATMGLGDPGWGETINTGNVLADVLLPGSGTALPYTDPSCNGNNATTAVGCPQQIRGVSETNVNPVDQGRWHDIEFYAGDSWKMSRRVTVNYGFRWSFLREPYDANNQMASFSLKDYNPSGNPNDACNGVILVPGTNFCTQIGKDPNVNLPLSAGTPGPNRALVYNNSHNIGPRLGIAWDIFGDGKTALRIGGGQFFQRERVSPQVGLSNTAPFSITAGGINRPLDTNPPVSGASTSPSTGRSPRAVTPNTWQWNLSVERELARNTTIQVGYVGNAGIHQTSTYDINQVPESSFGLGAFLPGSPNGATPSINALRPAANFGAINYFSRDGHASYHALQVMFRSKLRNFSTIQAAYTWSHTIANIEEDAANGGASQGSFTNIQNINGDRGNATINRPNIFVMNEVFFLPKLDHQNAVLRGVAGGWELNTIFTAENGNSMSVYQSGVSAATKYLDPAAPVNNCTRDGVTFFPCVLGSLSGTGYNNNQRPNVVPGVSCNSGQNGLQRMNPNAFTLIGFKLGSVGNAPRGICEGPHYVNADMGIYKNWHVKEKVNIRFSMDFFNAFNHTNFDANGIQGVGNQAGFFYNGGGVYCGANSGTTVAPIYEPCSPNNNVISAYGTTTAGIGGANPAFGRAANQANAIKQARELQYGLKITF